MSIDCRQRMEIEAVEEVIRFINNQPFNRPVPEDEGFDFPQIIDTQCSDMFRFTFMPRDQEGRTVTILEGQSQQLNKLIQVLTSSKHLMMAALALMTLITVMIIQL